MVGHKDGTWGSCCTPAPCSHPKGTHFPPPQLRQLLTHPQGEEEEDWKETQTRQVGWIRLLQALCSRGWGQRGCLVAAGRAGDRGEAPGALGPAWVGSMGRAGCWVALQGGRQFSETRAVISWWPGCPFQRPKLVVPSPLPSSLSLLSPGAAQPSPPATAHRVSASSPSPGLSRGPGRREDTGESEGSREPSHRHLRLVPASPLPHGQALLVVPHPWRWHGATPCSGRTLARAQQGDPSRRASSLPLSPSPISAFSPLCPPRRSRSPKNKRKEKNKERKR